MASSRGKLPSFEELGIKVRKWKDLSASEKEDEQMLVGDGSASYSVVNKIFEAQELGDARRERSNLLRQRAQAEQDAAVAAAADTAQRKKRKREAEASEKQAKQEAERKKQREARKRARKQKAEQKEKDEEEDRIARERESVCY